MRYVIPLLLCVLIAGCGDGEFVREPPPGIEITRSGGVDTARVFALGVAEDEGLMWEEPGPLQQQWLKDNGFAYAEGEVTQPGYLDSLQVLGDTMIALKDRGITPTTRPTYWDSMRTQMSPTLDTTTTTGSLALRGQRIYVRQSR